MATPAMEKVIEGWYQNATDRGLSLGPLYLAPKEAIELLPDTSERWRRIMRNAEWAARKGFLRPVTEEMARTAPADVEWEALQNPVVTTETNHPYLRPDKEDARLFLSQAYQTIRAQLKTIDRYELLGVYLKTAVEMGKSEAIQEAIASRMRAVQAAKKATTPIQK